MPERTIKVSAAYYTNPQGQSVLAFQGDKVDVHADAVKRFDDLNVTPERFIEEPAGSEEEAPLVYPGDAGEPEEKPRRGRPRKADSE